MMIKTPTKEVVKNSVSNSNLHAAPGTDGLTSYFYHHSWDIVGDALTDVVQEIHAGQQPTLAQRTSLMVFGCNPKQGLHQDSEAPTFNEQTIQSVDKVIIPEPSCFTTR